MRVTAVFAWGLQLLALSFCWAEPQKALEIIPDAGKIAIKTPAFAKRQTLKLRLPNGLEAYIVSDPAADRSAAGLCVGVGSWQDPSDVPGMAHFVEHLLFLGTEKYPEESGFDRFVGDHNGETNAHTSDVETCFFFAVDSAAFPESLTQFASFFKDPLFNASGVAREISAIDQEFSLAKQRDHTRNWLVLKELGQPTHPFHHFNYGNRATLSQVPRERVIQWHQEHYSANLMHLLIYSSLPLEQLKELVVSQFSLVLDRDKSVFRLDEPLTDSQLRGTQSWVEPIKQERTLTLLWEMPKEFADARVTKPHDLVGYVIGHEGSRSLLAQLKREKLAEGIEVGGYKMGADRFLFLIEIKLTKAGLAAKETVVERVFQEIETLRRKGIPRSLFDEIQQVQSLRYQYQMRDKAFDMVETYAPMMVDEPLNTFPEQQKVVTTYDPEVIQRFIAALTPQNVHINVVAPPPKEIGETLDRKEHWTDTAYRVSPIPTAQIALWARATPHPEIDLPGANSFIPRHLALVAQPEISPPAASVLIPTVIADEPFGKVYFAQDHQFVTPEISWSLLLLTPEIDSGDAHKTAIADLYVKSLTESLKDVVYDAQMAGLELQVKRDPFGIMLTLNGYSENALLVLRQVLERLKAVRPDQGAFRIYKEALLMQYTNYCREPALTQALYTLKEVLYKQYVTEAEKAKALKSIDHRAFLDAIGQLFRRNYSQLMLYGNLTATDATAVWQMVRQTVGGEPYPADQHPHLAVLQLSPEGPPIQLEIKSKAPGNAIILAIEDGAFSFKAYAIQKVLSQAMKAPFFSTLRTEQQTAYSLSSWEMETEKQLVTLFAAASSSHAVRDLLARFELMIEGYLQRLGQEELPEKAFESLQEAVALFVEQPPESFQEMGKRLTELAFDHDGDFMWNTQLSKAVRSLTYPEFLEGARAILGKQNGKRVAILLKGEIPAATVLEYQKSKGTKVLRQDFPYLPRKQ